MTVISRLRLDAIGCFALASLLVAGCSSDGSDVARSVPIGTVPVATATTLPSTVSAPVAPVESIAPVETVAPTVLPTSATPPDPASLTFTQVGSVEGAVDLAYRAGDDALFVVSQSGYIVAMRGGVVDNAYVLDISGDITSGGEQGLLGLAFSLDGQRAYVNYTNADGDTEITEYAVGADGVFDPSSKRLLLEIGQPHANHNGGQVRIGPDGYLYIGMGDGGSGGDPDRRALDVGDLLGKMLRIDPMGSGDSPYSIPPDNPFVGVDGARAEIWSVGLRNPWRFSFDLATNDLWIADVGQGEWEEIDVAWAADGGGRGSNFGWSAFEGTHPFNADQPADGVIAPIWEYLHGERGCSVSGGVRYRGSALPTLYGYYVYADYCNGEVRALRIGDDRTASDEIVLTDELSGLSEVAQGPDGEIYVLSVDAGAVYALRPAD